MYLNLLFAVPEPSTLVISVLTSWFSVSGIAIKKMICKNSLKKYSKKDILRQNVDPLECQWFGITQAGLLSYYQYKQDCLTQLLCSGFTFHHFFWNNGTSQCFTELLHRLICNFVNICMMLQAWDILFILGIITFMMTFLLLIRGFGAWANNSSIDSGFCDSKRLSTLHLACKQAFWGMFPVLTFELTKLLLLLHSTERKLNLETEFLWLQVRQFVIHWSLNKENDPTEVKNLAGYM